MVNSIDPLFVPVNDGAKILGIGRSKLYEEAAKGKLRIVKLGRKSLISVAALKEFADSLNQKAAA